MKKNLKQQILSALEGKKHIIWDWNGTLLSDVDHAVNTVNTLLTEHKLPRIDVESYKKVFDFPIYDYYKKLGFNFTTESFEIISAKYLERFMSGLHQVNLVPEMKSVIQSLHQNKIQQSVLSAADQNSLEKMIHHFDLNNYFTHIYGLSDIYAHSKVDRGLQLIKNIDIDPDKTVMIGDTLHDLEVATAMGIDAVLLSHGHHCVTRLKKHHDIVI